jgi:hypothetical protein
MQEPVTRHHSVHNIYVHNIHLLLTYHSPRPNIFMMIIYLARDCIRRHLVTSILRRHQMSWHTLNHRITQVILSNCEVRPVAKYNQLAVSCRSINVAWRRLRSRVILERLRTITMDLIEELGFTFLIRSAATPLQDIVDMLGWVPNDEACEDDLQVARDLQ